MIVWRWGCNLFFSVIFACFDEPMMDGEGGECLYDICWSLCFFFCFFFFLLRCLGFLGVFLLVIHGPCCS